MPVFLSSLSTWGKQRCIDCMRLLGWLFSLVLPKMASSSLSFRILTSSKVKPLTLKAARYFLTVFRDESIWAAIKRVLRPWLVILKIFLILLMLIVKLAILEQVFCPQKMVTSTAFATSFGGSVCPEIPWSVCPETWGQLAPKWCGHIHQNLQPWYPF